MRQNYKQTFTLAFLVTACSLLCHKSHAETVTRAANVSIAQTSKSALALPLKEVLKESSLRSAIDKHLATALLKGDPARVQPSRCDVYIKDDGSLGNVGEVAKQVLEQAGFKILKTPLADTDIPSLCPNFQRMNDGQKTAFWIWVLAGIEWDETSCGTRSLRERVPYSENYLVGRLHVPENKKERSALGAQCDEFTTDRGQLTCGYSAILYQLNRSNSATLLNAKSYYAVLRPNHPLNAAFRSYVSAFPVCGN